MGTGSQLTSGLSNSTFGNIPKRCPIIPQKHLFNYIHSNTTCNSQNLEKTYVPLNGKMVKEGVEHIYIRVLLSGKKIMTFEFCMQKDGNRKRYTE